MENKVYEAYMGVDQDDEDVLVKATVEDDVLVLRVSNPRLYALIGLKVDEIDIVELIKLFSTVLPREKKLELIRILSVGDEAIPHRGIVTYGQIAFEAYSKKMGGKTYDGKDIPQWINLSTPARFGWIHAAASAIRTYLSDQEAEIKKFLDNRSNG